MGLNPARDLIPVAPAAHYTMGGVATDLDGRSTLPGLYAVGEAACTGLHGANRLASNSLAECLVFGRRAALAACRRAGACPPVRVPRWRERRQPIRPAEDTRAALWRFAGLRRAPDGLAQLEATPIRSRA